MQFHYPFFFHEQHSLQDMFYGCSVPRQHYLHFLTNEGSPQKNKSQGCEKFLSKARLKATFESKQFDLHESPPGKQYELPCFLGWSQAGHWLPLKAPGSSPQFPACKVCEQLPMPNIRIVQREIIIQGKVNPIRHYLLAKLETVVWFLTQTLIIFI